MKETPLPIFLTTKQVAELTTLSTSTLERWRTSGTNGPPHHKLGEGRTSRVVYPLTDALAWLDSRRRGSTSQKNS